MQLLKVNIYVKRQNKIRLKIDSIKKMTIFAVKWQQAKQRHKNRKQTKFNRTKY